MPEEPYTSDTSADASEIQLELWRKMTGQQRVKKALALSAQLRAMAFDAIRRRHPEWNEDQVH